MLESVTANKIKDKNSSRLIKYNSINLILKAVEKWH